MRLSIQTHTALNISPTELEAFYRKNLIQKLSLFGSALRGELRAQSDIDLLVEFQPGREPGSIDLANMELELMASFGREVELRTVGDLSQSFRDEAASTAEVMYEEK